MHVSDLGVLEGDVCLFGGPYSNRQALHALLKVAGDAHLICTGDVVAYCGAPLATVAALRASGTTVVAGNCEKQLAQSAEDCGCGFEAGTTCDVLSAGWYGHAARVVSAEERAWMASLPDVVTFEHAARRYAVIHGGCTDIARFLWSTTPEAAFEEEWNAIEALTGPIDAVVAGHSGIAFDRQTARGRWINAGVIGMPPHDGDPRTAFAMLSEGDVQFHRLAYDVEGAYADMLTAGLTQGYHEGLRSGYWPSEDVLPESLRRSSSVASG